MRQRIVIDTPLELMPKQEQEYWWKKSRICDVFVRGADGDLWQVLDCTEGEDND